MTRRTAGQRPLRRFASLLAAGLLAACAADGASVGDDALPPLAPPPPGPAPFPIPAAAAGESWRVRIRPADLQRLQTVDEAWAAGLRQARRDSAERLESLGALIAPRAASGRPEPTPGLYRCRTVKLGGERGLPLVIYDWFACRIELTPGGDMRLVKLTGSQRQAGQLYPDTNQRQVFLGAVAWGAQETAAPAYGTTAERDQVGYFERIGERRWRLVLPWPRQESVLDLIEFVPA